MYIHWSNIFLCGAWNLRTYRFWAAGKKTPSLLFTLHKEKKFPFCQSNLLDSKVLPQILHKSTVVEGMNLVWKLRCRRHRSCIVDTTFHNSLSKIDKTSWVSQYVWRSNFPSFFTVSDDARWWMMRCYAVWYDEMMQLMLMLECFIKVRLCIPLGTTLGSLHLLLRWRFSSTSL
jgi:hypothetical protein